MKGPIIRVGSNHHFSKIYKTERIERLDENIFVVHASHVIKKLAQVSRNMVILRHNKRELTLVNPVRLNEAGEEELARLGSVRRIIRLAPHHGISHDRYYIERFPGVRRWAPLAQNSLNEEDELPIHRVLAADDNAILPSCHVFSFVETSQPECALLILRDYEGNLLITGSALQSHRHNPYVNALVRAKQTAEGMMQGSIVVPPSWLRNNAPGHQHLSYRRRQSLRSECERLLQLDFDRLISSSGVMVHQYAKEKAVLAVEQAFPQL